MARTHRWHRLKTLEIYNPAKKTFVLAAPLHYARQDHTATLLDDGSVLIAGGSNSSGPLASAEIYDPTTNTVSEAGSLNEARTLATASELFDFDGSVLIAGGQDANGRDLDSAEEFDPTTDSFTTLAAQMITPRSGHIGVTLPYNGKVLIAGGTSGGQIVSENEVYDPVSGTFVANEPMSVARDEFAANFFALPNVGQVLMTGGVDSTGDADRVDRNVQLSDHPHRQAGLSAGIAGHHLWHRMDAGRAGRSRSLQGRTARTTWRPTRRFDRLVQRLQF